MDLIKLTVAISIGIFLSLFMSETINFFYKSPNYNFASTTFTNECDKLIEEECGKDTYSEEYNTCSNKVYSSARYSQCNQKQNEASSDSLNKYKKQSEKYTLNSLIIYGILGIILIVIGFTLIKYSSISAGLILSGVFLIVLSGIFSLFTSLGSLMNSFGASTNGLQNTIQIVRIVLYLIINILLIVLSYLKLESKDAP